MQSSFLFTIQTANIPRETNKGFIMRFKTITSNLLRIVHLLVELITSLANPKASIEAYISIRQLP